MSLLEDTYLRFFRVDALSPGNQPSGLGMVTLEEVDKLKVNVGQAPWPRPAKHAIGLLR